MDDLDLLLDFHLGSARQGPGGDEETALAIQLAGLEGAKGLTIADIGCGNGASARQLARTLDAHVTAVDFLAPFLAELEAASAEAGLSGRITTLEASMDALPFADDQFDVIWAEGAIYNMGFKAGVEAWRRFLKPGGVLAVSELTWLTAQRPAELQAHWDAEYPEVDVASAKMAVLEQAGYSPMGYFTLPEHCWLENYYRPIQARFDAFLVRHGHSDAAKAIVAAERREIDLYERFKAYVSYGFYIARKV
jgi:SAM-dependent methyltransferase